MKESVINRLSSAEEAIRLFKGLFRGLVVYDGNVPATSNLASTAAGCEDLLPVRFDPSAGSLYDFLFRQMKLPVRLWLVKPDGSAKFTGSGMIPDSREASTGSAKIDAYRWAIRRYVSLWPLCSRHRGLLFGRLLASAPATGWADHAHVVQS